MNENYLIGSDIVGDMGTGGAPSLPVESTTGGLGKLPGLSVGPLRAPVIPGLTPVPPKPAAASGPNFLQRDAFGGFKVWQVGLASVGIVSILGGFVAIVARR